MNHRFSIQFLGIFFIFTTVAGCAHNLHIDQERVYLEANNAPPSFERTFNFIRPVGIIYTNIRLPLTVDLHNTPVPVNSPSDGRTLEIREPITGVGLYAKVDSNAIGDIAHNNGMKTLYFADQEQFSILGIWTTVKTILYGE